MMMIKKIHLLAIICMLSCVDAAVGKSIANLPERCSTQKQLSLIRHQLENISPVKFVTSRHETFQILYSSKLAPELNSEQIKLSEGQFLIESKQPQLISIKNLLITLPANSAIFINSIEHDNRIYCLESPQPVEVDISGLRQYQLKSDFLLEITDAAPDIAHSFLAHLRSRDVKVIGLPSEIFVVKAQVYTPDCFIKEPFLQTIAVSKRLLDEKLVCQILASFDKNSTHAHSTYSTVADPIGPKN